MQGGDSATMRQIIRGSRHCRAYNLVNIRHIYKGIRIIVFSSIKAIGGNHGFWLKLPRTSLARSFSAAAWPIRGAWWEGVGF